METRANPSGFCRLYDRALRLSALAHKGAARKHTEFPYILHPVHVARILECHGFSRDLVLAGLLHDVLEDTPFTDADKLREFRESLSYFRGQLPASASPAEFHEKLCGYIETQFGSAVLELVRAVTVPSEDNGVELSPQEKKQRQLDHVSEMTSDEAALKGADVLHNLESIMEDHNEVGDNVFDRFKGARETTVWYYRAVAKRVSEKLGAASPLARELTASAEEFAKTCGDAA